MKVVCLLVGLGLLVAGAVLAYLGLKPLAPLLELFTGGAAAAERHKVWLEDLEAHLGDAAVPVGLGIVFVLAGVVLAKMGLAPPKPKSVEQLVQEEVERRLGAQVPSPAAVAPAPAPLAWPATSPEPSTAVASPAMAAPRPVVAAPSPQSSPSPRRTHCASCGSVLVAGGRMCPRGHPQA